MSDWETESRVKQSANASSLLREKLEDLTNDDLRALRDTGLLDGSAYQTIISMKNGLKDSGVDYRKTETFQEILEYQTTKNLSKAIKEDNLSVKSLAVGRTRDSNSISQAHRIWALQDIITVQGRTFNFKGDPDTGKTNLALLMAEIWKKETGGKVITNMESVKRFKTVTNFKEWKKEFEKDDERILGIIEDASKHMSGYEVDRDTMEQKYRPFSINLAKNQGNMFLLGHTGMDIHPDARRKAWLVDKTSKKSTVIYKNVNKGKGSDERLKLSGLPKTSIKYDSSEKTKWDWGVESDELTDEDIKETIKDKIKTLAKRKNTIKRTDDLTSFKTQLAKSAMIEFAEKSEDWRFKNSPQRLEQRRI